MSASGRYTISNKDLVAETIDGEVVIVHFRTGNYYALNGLAADIWNWIAAGHSEEAIVAAVTSATEDAVGADIIDLIGELRDEGLIEPADGTELVEGAALSVRATGPYSSPQLEKYEDMQELITLDPIHEVNDEAGWPHRT